MQGLSFPAVMVRDAATGQMVSWSGASQNQASIRESAYQEGLRQLGLPPDSLPRKQPSGPVAQPAAPVAQPVAPGPQPAVVLPRAPAVQQAAQNPAVGTGQIGPVSPEVARLFLTQVQQDALRRGGFTDPTQVSPLRVSAPGTSRFLQDLSASVAGTLGFGPASLFFEELQKVRPTAVRAGIGRRTA